MLPRIWSPVARPVIAPKVPKVSGPSLFGYGKEILIPRKSKRLFNEISDAI